MMCFCLLTIQFDVKFCSDVSLVGGGWLEGAGLGPTK